MQHAQSGCKCKKQNAHTACKVTLEVCARAAGFSVAIPDVLPPRVDLRNPEKQHRERKADLSIIGFGRRSAVDVTVRNPMTTYLPAKIEKATFDKHITAAETEKNTKYELDYKKLGIDFVPFVMSSYGCYGPSANDLISKMAAHFKRNNPDCLLAKGAISSNLARYIQAFTLRALARNALSVVERFEEAEE